MPHTEPTVNAILAVILRPMLARATVAPENTGGVIENPAHQLDVLVTAPGRSPVSVETEFMPARTVEDDALSRLGKTARRDAKTIEAVIAVRYPENLRDDTVDIDAVLRGSRLTYAVFTQEGAFNNLRPVRFPKSGWLEGDVGDLADVVRLVSVPQRAVDQAAENLESGINMAAYVLAELDSTRVQINLEIAAMLGMENGEQTRRMASAIVANAMVFHERIVGMHPDASIKTLYAIAGPGAANSKVDLLESWRQILGINYHPIFEIARGIVECLPAEPAARFIRILSESGNYVNAAGIDNAHDLTGRVFQRLIADRKYLATFYTLPSSAALLARLAVAKLQNVDWSDPAAITKLRIADFACGTGALLSATYEQIVARHARTGGDPRNIHTAMLEDVLIGCDVMPSAVHITASTLAGIEPDMPYSRARLYTMPYGLQSDGDVRIGSLEFLAADSAPTLTDISGSARQVGSTGNEAPYRLTTEILDLVIMNPPFTRATNHEGPHADVVNPAFAAFDATKADMDAMGTRMSRLGSGSAYHGNAGIASAFAALAHNKLKPGGVLAIVLPLSVANGLSWERFRLMLATRYTNLSIATIAAADTQDMAFSADTGMADCLVIAQKRNGHDDLMEGGFISLSSRPRNIMQGWLYGDSVANSPQPRSLDDGPFGGTVLTVSGQSAVSIGEVLRVPIWRGGEAWGAVRVKDLELAQTARSITQSRLWLPGSPVSIDLAVSQLSQLAQLGLVDRDITGPAPRGPFDRRPSSPTATYPALWNHNARRETRIVCEPDSELRVRRGLEAKAAVAWETSSRAHINRDFTFGSQALAVAFTERESIGGRVWPNVSFRDSRMDYAFAIWGNSTLGLLLYWWHSSRQQSSKAGMTIRAAESMPVLDFRELSDDQLATAERIFEEFRDKEFMPAYLADADPNRDLLDRRVVMDMLGFDEKIYLAVRLLAQKLCAEPSVHGGKARPRDARPIPDDGSPPPESPPRMDLS